MPSPFRGGEEAAFEGGGHSSCPVLGGRLFRSLSRRLIRLRRTILAGALVAAATAPAAAAAAGEGKAPRSAELRKYSALYHAVKNRHGTRAPGRNIRRYGVRTKSGRRPATGREIAKSIRVLRSLLTPMLAPAPPRIPPSGAMTARAPAGGTLARIAACESGGSPTAIDPTGTFRGKYQFDRGTWASVGGSGDPAAASEAEQDERAAVLYLRRGAAPWPVCGR